MKYAIFCSLVTILIGAAWLTTAQAQQTQADWPTFRGADRSGVAPDTNLLEKWPEGGPKLLWESEGAGRGYASLVVSGDRMYTLGDGLSTAKDKDEYLVCFDRANGKQLWTAKTGSPWTKGQASWQSSRSTPTIDGDYIYVITPNGVLVCVDKNGDETFRVDLTKKYGGKKADSWGYSESVLVDGDNLICTPGGPTSTIVALNKKTGEKVWSTPRKGDRGAAHPSIVISKVGGTKVYVQTTGSGVMGVRASDGKLLWTYDVARTTAIAPTPIIRDDLVFFSAGYGRGGALLRQVPDGDAVNVEEVYGLNPKLTNKHGGIVLVGDYLYGDTDDKGNLFCAEFMTGNIKWKSRGSGRKSAAVAAADGHLYFLYANGTMTLVKADPEKMQEVGSFKIPDNNRMPSWAHPVISKGKLYLREGDKIFCFDISADESAAAESGGTKPAVAMKKNADENEMLANANFANGMEGWGADLGEPANGKVEVVKEGPEGLNALRVEVLSVPEEAWQLQVYNPGLKIKEGKDYVFTFWCKSKTVDTVTVNCMQNHEPWEHSTQEEFYPETKWRKHTFEFEGPWDDDNSRITFTNLGNEEGQVFWFAGCSLKEKK